MGKKKAAPGGDNPAGQLVTDAGGRPVVDAGGRLVFTDNTTGAEQLDPKGTPPVEPKQRP
jgi:hypothetical protein